MLLFANFWAHGLIKKVPRYLRYFVTNKDHRIMGALIEITSETVLKIPADIYNLVFNTCEIIKRRKLALNTGYSSLFDRKNVVRNS